MSYFVDLQMASATPLGVKKKEILAWAKLPLSHHLKAAELTVRLVDKDEIHDLNRRYRQQDKPTNVLAFPSRLPKHIQFASPLLGDVIACPEVIQTEAIVYEKPVMVYWAHILIHGVLHLLGYDHIEEEDAARMMAWETKLLAELGFENPYSSGDIHFEG